MSAAQIIALLKEEQERAAAECHDTSLMKWYRDRQGHHADRLRIMISKIERS